MPFRTRWLKFFPNNFRKFKVGIVNAIVITNRLDPFRAFVSNSRGVFITKLLTFGKINALTLTAN